MTAQELLEAMRFDVEGILLECQTQFGKKFPTCKSQSHRAIKAIPLLRDTYSEAKNTLKWRITTGRKIEALEIFLGIHKTVELLDKAGQENKNIFGQEIRL